MLEPIRVFMVDDHAVVRRGLSAFFEQVDDIVVVGEAADGDQAIGHIGQLAAAGELPDVVLMDVLMPRLGGISATATLIARHPGIRVVVLTSAADVDQVQAALAEGAAGYVLKHAEADEVALAIRAAHRGELHLDAAVALQLAKSLREPRPRTPALTPREREILALVGQGASNQQIADELVISERTARTHVSNILAKLGLSSRTQAALWAVKEGIVEIAG